MQSSYQSFYDDHLGIDDFEPADGIPDQDYGPPSSIVKAEDDHGGQRYHQPTGQLHALPQHGFTNGNDVLSEFLEIPSLDSGTSYDLPSLGTEHSSLSQVPLVVDSYDSVEDPVPTIVVDTHEGEGSGLFSSSDLPGPGPQHSQQFAAIDLPDTPVATTPGYLFAERQLQYANDDNEHSTNSPITTLDPFSPINSSSGSPVPFPALDNSTETVSPMLSPFLQPTVPSMSSMPAMPASTASRHRAVSDSILPGPYFDQSQYGVPPVNAYEYGSLRSTTLGTPERFSPHEKELWDLFSQPSEAPYQTDHVPSQSHAMAGGRSRVRTDHLQAPSQSLGTSRSSSRNRVHKTTLAPPRNRARAVSNPLEMTGHDDELSGSENGQGLMFCCDQCDKKFTRAYNLRSHMRTHTDERPYVCSVCGKAFARLHDRKRHEDLHSGEKKYFCGGKLSDQVGPWGCNRRFARADALGRHFRTDCGKSCIQPLVNDLRINPDLEFHPEGITLRNNPEVSGGLELALICDGEVQNPSQRAVIATAITEHLWGS